LELILLILLPILILLFAAFPVILLFIFSEEMAAKEGESNIDAIRKIAKYMAWFLLALFLLFVIYSLFEPNDGGRFHLRRVFKVISAILRMF